MDTKTDIIELKDQIEAIVLEAGETILSYYRDAESMDVREKSPDNPVTEADLAADTLLKSRCLALLPAAGWLSEETVDNPQRLERPLVWVVDPLDGTKEFVMGIPEFSVSVALCEDGQPIVGAIYNPVTREMFAAARGHGLTLNGSPVEVTDQTMLAGSLIEASRSEMKRGEFDFCEKMVELKMMGSIAYKLARTAAGLADATWSRGPKHEWDVCAGVLLVEEGGGRCVDLDDRPFTFNQSFPKINGIIADNGHLHDEIITLLAPHRETART